MELSELQKIAGIPVEAQKLQELNYKGLEYARLKSSHRTLEEGTVIFPKEGEMVRGYPKIRRALVLEPALKKHFPGKFAAEEKIDGYNVRATLVGGNLIAITRSGFICPFSTHIANKLLNKKFFEENKGLVLCGEIAGELNPHVVHEYPVKTGFYSFAIMKKGTGEFMPVLERRQLLERYKLQQVPLHGIFTAKDWKRIRKALETLEKKGKEGLVLKALDSNIQFKYTASNANLGDLSYAFRFPFDIGREFMFRRIIREAFQSVELGEGRREAGKRAKKLGDSILKPFIETIKTIKEGKQATDDCEIEDYPGIEDFLAHLKEQHVDFSVEKVHKRVKIKRKHQSTNDRTRAYLSGEFSGE